MKVLTTLELKLTEEDIKEAVWYWLQSKQNDYANIKNLVDIVISMSESEINFDDSECTHSITIRSVKG